MNSKLLSFAISVLSCCFAQAQIAPKAPADGWSGLVLSNATLQKSTQAALRNRPSPFRPDLVTDRGARLLNFLALQYRVGDWTFSGAYSDNRTLSGADHAYSLTNPMGFGVNTVETTGPNREAVNFKSGLQELAATYRKSGTLVMAGKIDTAHWYLANPLFGGDLTTGNDYGNAATRAVAPPFPSLAVVVRQDFGNGLSLTGIAGDAFGDRETLNAGRNLAKGDLAYVLELNFQDADQHYQLTLNHVDAFRYYDKDAVWPGAGDKGPSVDAVMATASYRLNPNWAGFARVSYAKGAGQIEDLNYLGGVRFDLGKFYLLASQSATRVAIDNTPYQRGARGDITYVSELTLNYKLHPRATLGLTYDLYNSSGDALLAKDGGWSGAKRNQIIGLRATSFLPF